MGSRLGRRVVHFANLPIKMLMPTSFENIREIALKTIPSASKIEIKRVLESLYGFEVDKVRTLNMDGKKKKRGGILIAKPDYKKAYVTLKNPLSISPNLFPIPEIEEEKRNTAPKKSKSEVVGEGGRRSHWLDDPDAATCKNGRYNRQDKKFEEKRRGGGRNDGDRDAGKSKFPWSSMQSWRSVIGLS